VIPFILALASFNISNTQDYEVMRFECVPATPATVVSAPCQYQYLVIVDKDGKEHRYRIEDVKEQAIKELKKLEVKEEDKK